MIVNSETARIAAARELLDRGFGRDGGDADAADVGEPLRVV
jgi:hypothetical protein